MKKPMSFGAGIVLLSSFSVIQTAMAETEQASQQDTIIITGQKIERSLQDTKESVVVLTEEMLEQRNLVNLNDVIDQTPGISGDKSEFRIRGVRSTDGAASPNRADLASVVVDGVTTSGFVKTEGTGSLWDVSQVEVLRGPQSTNLGRNALAGAVVINTNDPVYSNEGKVLIGAGNADSKEFKGMMNFNLVDGVAAFRVAVEQNKTDGHINNLTRGEDDYGRRENNAYRTKLLLEPTEDLSMVLSYQHLENYYGASKIRLDAPFTEDDRVSLNDDEESFESDADLASLTLDYNLNDNWTLKSVSAYQDGERERFSDTDSGPDAFPLGGSVITRSSEDTMWSQELRFNFDSGDLRGSTGVFYTNIDADIYQDRRVGIDIAFQADRLLAPGAGAFLVQPAGPYEPFYNTSQAGSTKVETTSWAAFTEWELDIKTNWTVSAGLRYDNEEQDFSTVSSTQELSTLPDPAAYATVPNPFFNPALPPSQTNIPTLGLLFGGVNQQLRAFSQDVPYSDTSTDFDNILPHAGITYHWNDNVSSSFFVKKSYRSGGSSLSLFSGVYDFDEEELWNYEFSHRAVILDGKGVLNANLYYADWTDQQVDVVEQGALDPSFTVIENAGESELYGLELSFDYQLNEEISVYLGGAYNETEYKEFNSSRGDLSGNEFRLAPKYTASAGVTYANAQGFFGNVTTNYNGSAYADVENESKMDGYALVNLNGGYEIQDFRFEAYLKNAFDKTYDTNNNIATTSGDPMTILGDPRTYGARVTYSF